MNKDLKALVHSNLEINRKSAKGKLDCEKYDVRYCTIAGYDKETITIRTVLKQNKRKVAFVKFPRLLPKVVITSYNL